MKRASLKAGTKLNLIFIGLPILFVVLVLVLYFLNLHYVIRDELHKYGIAIRQANNYLNNGDIENALRNIEVIKGFKHLSEKIHDEINNIDADCRKANSPEYYEQVIIEMDDVCFNNYVKYGENNKKYFTNKYVNEAFVIKMANMRKDAKKLREKLLLEVANNIKLENERIEKEKQEKIKSELEKKQIEINAKKEREKQIKFLSDLCDISISERIFGQKPGINLFKYQLIKHGMSYSQVYYIIGKDGVETASSPGWKIYSWEQKDSLGGNANITFKIENFGEEVHSKAQYGLR
jgi:hypothetical protein